MQRSNLHTAQRGATLVVALIMLALITLLVVNAFTLSNSNMRAVGNMQIRDEAVAAANQAIEQLMGTTFTTTPTVSTYQIDMNQDGVPDYTVVVSAPTCSKAAQASTGYPSDVELGSSMSSGGTWYTDWDLLATVNDAATGASIKIRQGVTVLLSHAQKTLVCKTV